MKKYSLAFFILLSAGTYAQNCPLNFLGTKTLYPVTGKKYTSSPKNYSPVFINHAGRHGARHLTKDVAASFALLLLAKADSLNALTQDGKNLLQMTRKLEKIEKKDFELISLKGKQEQHDIAERMLVNYPEIFSNPSVKVKVMVAKKARTSQSADAFLTGLKEKINVDDIKKTVNDTLLRFYDLSPAYTSFDQDGSWIQQLEKFKETKKINDLAKLVTQKFFNPSFLKQLSDGDIEKFDDDLFGFAVIVYSLQKEIQNAGYKPNEIDFTSYFTCQQLSTLNQINDAQDFFVKGPGTDVNGIQVKIAAPLLANFIKTTDDFIANKKTPIQLRFCHAETISPFATLLGIKGASQPVNKINDIPKVWKSAEVIPLSANIQWILYKKNDSEDYIIKFLLNEKEVAINGLNSKAFPYYNWTDVRNFYISKLQTMHTDIAANGYKYLQEVK